jgi:DNA-binding transcriptional regulator YiaG
METYHYTECGLENIYLKNGFTFIDTPRGKAISIKDVDGLHKAIGMYLVNQKKDLTSQEISFLRNELLMSQKTLSIILGVSEQAIHRWEKGKTAIPKPSELLLRLLYKEHIDNQNGKISKTLKEIALLEDTLYDSPVFFKETLTGWKAAA